MSQDDFVKLIEIRNELVELIRRENKRSVEKQDQLHGGVSYLEFGALASIDQVIDYVKFGLKD